MRRQKNEKGIKFFQTQYAKIKFGGSLEEEWETHLEEFEDICEEFDIEERDRTNVLRYTLKEYTKQLYKNINETNPTCTETKYDFSIAMPVWIKWRKFR